MDFLLWQLSWLAFFGFGGWISILIIEKLKKYKMPERNNPETSNEAWRSITNEQLNDTYKKIIFALNNIGEGTFEDIASFLKVDKTKIWKRMSELQRMEIVYRPGNKKVLKSGRNGYTWMLCGKGIKKVATERTPKGNTVSDFSKNILKQSNLFL